MKISGDGLALIKSNEALRLKAYVCPAGVLTIGYGHTGDDVIPGELITADEAEMILRRDVARFEACVAEACKQTSQGQFDAMVCLAFNIGEAAFRKSSVARLHNAGRYAEASQAFMLWNKAKGIVLAGLVKRRAAESTIYLDGTPEEEPGAPPPQDVEGEKPLKSSRTINGGIGAIATTGATVAVSAVKDTQFPADGSLIWDAFGQVMPYVQQYGWMVGVAALGLVGYMMYARWSDRNAGRA